QVQAGWKRNPIAWAGRMLLVRGTITGSRFGSASSMPGRRSGLSDDLPFAGGGIGAGVFPRGDVATVDLAPDIAHRTILSRTYLATCLSLQKGYSSCPLELDVHFDPPPATQLLVALHGLPFLGSIAPVPLLPVG